MGTLMLALAPISSPVRAQTTFVATLTGAQATPPDASTGIGFGIFTLNAAQTDISWQVIYTGLTGPAIASHLHVGPAGVAGPVIVPFVTTSSPIVGSGAFPAAHLADLFAGNVYVNIHTAVYPGGEIRGQLILQHQVPEPTTALALVPALVPVGLMLRRRRRAVA
jgi:hypothetical protein